MTRRLLALATVAALTLIACGGTDTDVGQRIETVDPSQAAGIIADAPNGLVILDVRTPAEFAEARLDGSIMVDYNAADFRDRVDELAKDVPYVMYCRSGNRSAGAREIMRELGFTEVYEIGGGINDWVRSGLPVVSG